MKRGTVAVDKNGFAALYDEEGNFCEQDVSIADILFYDITEVTIRRVDEESIAWRVEAFFTLADGAPDFDWPAKLDESWLEGIYE